MATAVLAFYGQYYCCVCRLHQYFCCLQREGAIDFLMILAALYIVLLAICHCIFPKTLWSVCTSSFSPPSSWQRTVVNAAIATFGEMLRELWYLFQYRLCRSAIFARWTPSISVVEGGGRELAKSVTT